VLGGGLFLVGIALLGQIYNLAGREVGRPSSCGGRFSCPRPMCSRRSRSLRSAGLAPRVVLDVRPRSYDLASAATSIRTKPPAAVAFGAAGVLVWALGALHGDGSSAGAPAPRTARAVTILVAMVPSLAQAARAWWTRGATRWAGGGAGADSGSRRWRSASRRFRLPHDRPVVRAGPARRSSSWLLYLFAVTLQLIHRAAADVFRVLAGRTGRILLVVALALILYGARLGSIGLDQLGGHLDRCGRGRALRRARREISRRAPCSPPPACFVIALGGALRVLRRRVTRGPGAAGGARRCGAGCSSRRRSAGLWCWSAGRRASNWELASAVRIRLEVVQREPARPAAWTTTCGSST